jgi:glucose-1-phosphate cytidylyltransferase
MQAVILCGGKGTRMREETEFKPKPLVDIGGKPILCHIMDSYSRHRHNDFILCLGYLGEMIDSHFRSPSHETKDFNITTIYTGEENMTGSRVKQVGSYIEGDTFMVTYGDGVSDIDISKLVEFHKSHGKLATVSAHRPTSRYGVLEIKDDNSVSHFAEKPQLEDYVSMGFFVFQKEVLNYIDDDPNRNLEREPLQKLAEEGQLMAYKHEGLFHPMDTYRDYLLLNDLWNKNEAPWALATLATTA